MSEELKALYYMILELNAKVTAVQCINGTYVVYLDCPGPHIGNPYIPMNVVRLTPTV